MASCWKLAPFKRRLLVECLCWTKWGLLFNIWCLFEPKQGSFKQMTSCWMSLLNQMGAPFKQMMSCWMSNFSQNGALFNRWRDLEWLSWPNRAPFNRWLDIERLSLAKVELKLRLLLKFDILLKVFLSQIGAPFNRWLLVECIDCKIERVRVL